ncbi:MAG: hypothetical protein ACREMV_13225 [Gemmatimonadales bacterium]
MVMYDSECEGRDLEELDHLGTALSRGLGGPTRGVINHDDSILVYQLHRDGELLDEYYSNPAVFDGKAAPGPQGGDPVALVRAFGLSTTAVEEVGRILTRSYAFETDRHRDLVNVLGLPDVAVGAGYRYIDRGDPLPGLGSSHLFRV